MLVFVFYCLYFASFDLCNRLGRLSCWHLGGKEAKNLLVELSSRLSFTMRYP